MSLTQNTLLFRLFLYKFSPNAFRSEQAFSKKKGSIHKLRKLRPFCGRLVYIKKLMFYVVFPLHNTLKNIIQWRVGGKGEEPFFHNLWMTPYNKISWIIEKDSEEVLPEHWTGWWNTFKLLLTPFYKTTTYYQTVFLSGTSSLFKI